MSSATRRPTKTLRELRQARGWTQLDLALQLGASVNAVSKWERGQAKPIWVYRRRLAEVVEVSVGEIAFGQGEE